MEDDEGLGRLGVGGGAGGGAAGQSPPLPKSSAPALNSTLSKVGSILSDSPLARLDVTIGITISSGVALAVVSCSYYPRVRCCYQRKAADTERRRWRDRYQGTVVAGPHSHCASCSMAEEEGKPKPDGAAEQARQDQKANAIFKLERAQVRSRS